MSAHPLILLHGMQRIIICPARSSRSLLQRVPPELREPLTTGRLLILSPFAGRTRRVTTELAGQRNEFVAALADEVVVAHATSGGRMETLLKRLRNEGRSVTCL